MREHYCSVVGCRLQHRALHTLPASEELRLQWIHFIYDGKVPVPVGKKPIVCANHFLSDCFQNLGQYNAGLAAKLLLKEGAVPTVRGPTAGEDTASTSGVIAVVKHVASQTDPPTTRTTGTQLGMKTLQPHFRSTGTQNTVSCTDVGVGTSAVAFSASRPVPTSIKSQCKRRRLEEEEEEEENLLNGSSVDTEEPHDRTDDPADTSSESADVTLKSSPAVCKTHTVYESCLMELFEECPVCQRECDVRSRPSGTFLSVEQRCLHCEFYRKWNSRPPAGNLQPSTALL
ncbi:uncharacterized protein LOC127370858 [Dicentrarchus labrax]|uniref:uncharacterized protein LOC127370858 n=1 Tax=Dicentrarchus labrax TaxID=13489 RepID=UPI0021F62705|nr:uncharacterized protein LOC127370858 [Dicentrarchus labrax]XP_051269264.1 uncharacterized protein LOC127370858 [Dicentrarchus labrax]